MWYVIHTMSGQEQDCKLQCEKYVDGQAYQELFIPQYIAQKHFKKEWHDVKKTLFPGYLFVDTEDIGTVMEGLKKFRQYTKVLRDGELVSPITQEEQAFLSAMMDKDHIVKYSEGFLIGKTVCITQGPLRNYQGNIKNIDRHRRIAKIDVPIFGRMTPVELGFGAFARLSEEEFSELKAERIQKQEQELKNSPDQVEVLTGPFKGVRGTFLYANAEQDEWTVEIDLFGVGTKVMFRRGEIRMFSDGKQDKKISKAT